MPDYVFPLPTSALRNRPDQTYHVQGASDLLAPIGTPVGSVTGGTVKLAGYDSVGGNYVEVLGADGLTYYYAHLRDAPSVAAGQLVHAGQLLGLVGKTGNASTLPDEQSHLHIGIGHGIAEGTGASGGAGIGFNAQQFLDKLLDSSPVSSANGSGSTASAPVYHGQSVKDWITEWATYLGIDVPTALHAAETEGGLDSWGRIGDVSQGGSYGPFQLFYGGGLGNQFTVETGIAPGSPQFGPASVAWALQWIQQNGWYIPGTQQGFHGPRNAGYTQWQGITRLPLQVGQLGSTIGGTIENAIGSVGSAVGSLNPNILTNAGLFTSIGGLIGKALGLAGIDTSGAQAIGLDLVLLIVALFLILAGAWGVATSSGTGKLIVKSAVKAAA